MTNGAANIPSQNNVASLVNLSSLPQVPVQPLISGMPMTGSVPRPLIGPPPANGPLPGHTIRPASPMTLPGNYIKNFMLRYLKHIQLSAYDERNINFHKIHQNTYTTVKDSISQQIQSYLH